MPARVDDQNTAARRKARVQRGGVPLPHLAADGWAVRLGAVLEGIIDYQDVPSHSGDAAAHARAAVAAPVADDLEQIGIPQVAAGGHGADVFGGKRGLRENGRVLRLLDDPLHVAVEAT